MFVVIGGFYVVGCLLMFLEILLEIEKVMDFGVMIYVGEVEGWMDELFCDMWNWE